MRYEVQEQSPVERVVHLHPEQDALEHERQRVAVELAKTVDVPGFRKGKVPSSIVRTKFAQRLEEAVAYEIVHSALPEVLSEKGWTLLENGAYIEKDRESGQSIRPDGGIKVVLECLPQRNLDIPKLDLESEEVGVSPGEVRQALEQLRTQHATLKPVLPPRPAAVGDVLELKEVHIQDATVPSGGIVPEEKRELGVYSYEVLQGKGKESDPMLGMRVGEMRTLETPIESEEASQKPSVSIRKFLCRQVCEKELPRLDDEFAKTVGKVTNVKALETEVTKALTKRKAQDVRSKNRRSVIQRIVGANDLPVPGRLAAQIFEEHVHMVIGHLEAQGVDLSGVEQPVSGELLESVKKEADLMAKFTIFSEVYGKKEGIEVGAQEVATLFRSLNINKKKADKELDEERKTRLRRHILREKVVVELIKRSRGKG